MHQGNLRKQEIPNPVAGSRKRHGFCAISAGEQLSTDRPDHGAPGRGESENEEACENDEANRRTPRILGIVQVEGEGAYGRKNHETHKHPQGTGNQRFAAAVVLDNV